MPRKVWASEVVPETDKTPEQLKLEAAAAEVKRIRARREAVRRSGGDPGMSSEGLAASLERSAEKAREESIRRFKAKQAARALIREKRGT